MIIEGSQDGGLIDTNYGGMVLSNDLEGSPVKQIVNISKSKVQPINDSRESIESSSVAKDENGPIMFKGKGTR